MGAAAATPKEERRERSETQRVPLPRERGLRRLPARSEGLGRSRRARAKASSGAGEQRPLRGRSALA